MSKQHLVAKRIKPVYTYLVQSLYLNLYFSLTFSNVSIFLVITVVSFEFYDLILSCKVMPIKKVKKVSVCKSAYFRRTDFQNFSVATAVIF